jgi:hypothetical protein
VTGPPVDAAALARHLGLVIDLERSPRGRGRRQILVRPEPTEERRQAMIAHEIGQHFKPQLLRRLGIAPGEKVGLTGESLPNLFAQRLLVPTPWLAEEARASDHDLLALKARFPSAGHEMIAWRLLDLPGPCVITIVDNDEVQRRRGNAWRAPRHLSPVERECQRYVHHYSRPQVVDRAGWRVQGWPIHEADWKREVLRSVVEEELLQAREDE